MDRIFTELQILTQIGLYGKISRLRSKSGSEDRYGIINRLRDLLVELIRKVPRNVNIGRDQQIKRLVIFLSELCFINSLLDQN